MSEKNDFALVQRPASALEKAAPGAKRILSGMVDDALDLTRKTASEEVSVADLQLENWFETGLKYYFGQGVPQDYAEAVKWFRKAAERGFAKAQYALGICYQDGKGVPEEDVEAAKWFALAWHRKMADEQNEAFHQYALGWHYEQGQGVPQDYPKAVMWYRKAADQNHARAQYFLGWCYENGRGVPQNFPEAYKLFKLAAEQNQENAVENLKTIVTRMTAAEIAEGERRVREFRSQN